jgi:hypothetical protein
LSQQALQKKLALTDGFFNIGPCRAAAALLK